MDITILIFTIAGAVAAIVAAVFAFLARRDYLRDARAPYHFDVIENWSRKTVVFVNPRPAGTTIVDGAVDIDGDGRRVVHDAFAFGDLKYPPYSVPGGTCVRLRRIKRADDGVTVNVNSRIVLTLIGGETVTSASGILAEECDKSTTGQR